MIHDSLSYYKTVKEKVQQAWSFGYSVHLLVSEQVYSHPPIVYLLSLTTSCWNAAQELITSLLHGSQFQQLRDALFSRLDIYTATSLRLLEALINKRSLFAFSLDIRPHDGFCSYTQALPIYWQRFQDPPRLMELFSGGDMMNSPPVDIAKFQLDMHHTIRSLLALVATRTFLPPFSATAMLIGDTQIMTFDRNFYDFRGDCSYLLTSDFRHNRFAVVANYKAKKRESLQVLTDNKNIVVQRDGRVFVDDSRVELPAVFGGTYIRREGHRVILHSQKGLLLDCNTVHNICTLKLSGWYFARTGGLLGVYDNEPSNDWMTADRQLVDDLPSFIHSWQVGHCKDITAAAAYAPLPPVLNVTVWDREKCADLFLNPETSLLLPCYASVDPQPYHQVCLEQAAAADGSPVAAGFCQAAAAYAEDCRLNSVEIFVPGDCVTCIAPLNAPLRGGETVSYLGNAPQSMDIIFVVEQAPCLQQLRFKSIIPLIESSLLEAKILDNQYALVGFGGEGELKEPHTFTSASKGFSDAKGILQAFSR